MKEPLFSAPPGWTRRRFLKGSAAALAGVYGLSRDFALAEQVPDKFDGLGFKLAAPEPNAKSGGVLRMGIPNRPPHFDIHQSGTLFNLGAQGCMFDNLVRRDPRADGRGGTRKWHNRPGLSSARPSASQTPGASHPENAAAISQYRMQSEDDGRVGVVRRHQKRKLRFGDRCHRFRPCSTPLITSMPGIPRMVRRTTRFGTIRSRWCRSHGRKSTTSGTTIQGPQPTRLLWHLRCRSDWIPCGWTRLEVLLVAPAKAGVQVSGGSLDSRSRENGEYRFI
jgi:hypothetical protein